MKRYLMSVLIFILSFSSFAFAFDEVEAVGDLDKIKVANTIEEKNFVKREYAYAYISPGRFVLYQSAGNNQFFISQASAGDYAKIYQVGNSNTATIIQH